MTRLLVAVIVTSTTVVVCGADSLPRLNVAPQSVEQQWAGYDPRSEPLEASTTPNFSKRSKTPFDESRSTTTAKPSRPIDHFQ